MNVRRLLPVSTMAIAFLATQLPAQAPGYGGGMGSMGGMGRRDQMRPRGEPGRALPSANQLEGPPIPDFFVDRFGLDSAQAYQYRSVYDSFMSATATIRDSAQTARRTIDAAVQSGDRVSARASFPLLQTLGDSLAKADDRFDDRLKAFLTSGQIKTYKKWKDEQRRQEEADRHQEMEPRTDRNSSP
jgi:hypothetical protein